MHAYRGKGQFSCAVLTISHIFIFIACGELHISIHKICTDQVKTRQSNSPYNLNGKDKSPHYTAYSSAWPE